MIILRNTINEKGFRENLYWLKYLLMSAKLLSNYV
jgi:hypothetical protein